ncbi:MAG: DsrE family protein [Crocosphaera sp.]|nr:DsrE family protein [Crocosphaera sp.]
MSKTAIVILSDPNNGEDALGRVFNALLLGIGLKQKNENFEIVFQGAGSRWPAHLVKEDHPANGAYKAVEDHVRGVCGGCADVFGATQSVETETSLDLIRELKIEGTGGVVDLAQYVANGDNLVIF